MLKLRFTTALLGAGLMLGVGAHAQEQPDVTAPANFRPTAAQLKQGREALSKAAEDPTASFWKLEVNSTEVLNYQSLNSQTANTTSFRFGGPFKWGDQLNIFRVALPFITDHATLQNGLSDISVFDLVVFKESWGRWGFGPVALFPTGGSTRGGGQYAAGPVIGIVFSHGKLLYGVLNQNLFTYAGDGNRPPLRTSSVQPIVNQSLGNGWSVGSSDMVWTYNYYAGRWTNQPVGVRLSKVARFFRRPIQVSLEYEWNFSHVKGDIDGSLRFNFVLFQRNPFAPPRL
jgi:hypothetical protein